jgi:hypothetical protein
VNREQHQEAVAAARRAMARIRESLRRTDLTERDLDGHDIDLSVIERALVPVREPHPDTRDALRWRAVRDELAILPYASAQGLWRIVGNDYRPHPAPLPATIDEAADRLSALEGETTQREGQE